MALIRPVKLATNNSMDRRLTKGAGTHLASWLQEVAALTPEEAQALLDATKPAGHDPKSALAKEGLLAAHGRKLGHAKPVSDIAYSGDILVSKDASCIRMWRARGDFCLLRVVTCPGKHVAIHPCGQFIATGTRGAAVGHGGLKIWGPAGGSAYTAGKKTFTTGLGGARSRRQLSSSKVERKGDRGGCGGGDAPGGGPGGARGAACSADHHDGSSGAVNEGSRRLGARLVAHASVGDAVGDPRLAD